MGVVSKQTNNHIRWPLNNAKIWTTHIHGTKKDISRILSKKRFYRIIYEKVLNSDKDKSCINLVMKLNNTIQKQRRDCIKSTKWKIMATRDGTST